MVDGRTAVLVVSFGTTDQDALSNSIEAVEDTVRDILPDEAAVFRAFTSKMIVRMLQDKGRTVFSLPKALDAVVSAGFDRLLVISTHVLAGSEYAKLADTVMEYRDLIRNIKISKPLVTSVLDLRTILDALNSASDVAEDEALVLVGHGTCHPIDVTYAAMNYEARQMGLEHVFVGTVEGYPGLSQSLENVKRAGYRKACLAPMLLVAGNHAKVDIAGDEPDSWKSRFASEGISCRCYMKGLGENAAIRQIFAKRALEAYKEIIDAE